MVHALQYLWQFATQLIMCLLFQIMKNKKKPDISTSILSKRLIQLEGAWIFSFLKKNELQNTYLHA